MILYDYWRSSSAWRVRIALHFKGIPFERRVVNLIKDGGEQHAADVPRAQPVAAGAGADHSTTAARIAQSMAIIDYLEERFPAPPLLPADPWLRARARQLAEMVNSGIQPLQNLAVLDHVQAGGVDRERVGAPLHRARARRRSKPPRSETAGTFLVGDAPSLADVYLIPQLYSARRFGVDLAPFPTLLRVEAACAALPAFAAAHPDAQSDAVPTRQT